MATGEEEEICSYKFINKTENQHVQLQYYETTNLDHNLKETFLNYLKKYMVYRA